MAASIVLWDLGGSGTSPTSRPPRKNDYSAAPSKSDVHAAVAGPRPPRKKPETATTKTTTPPDERKGPTRATPMATYATRPAAPPQLRYDERISGSGAPPTGSRFAAKTVHQPMSYPHPFP